MTAKKGVSVIICCYNSEIKIQHTLKALSLQTSYTKIEWELILVDNASNDNTVAIAGTIWQGFKNGIPIHFVYEPVAGLSYARKRGIQQAKYETILFCDDDNWLIPGYIQTAHEILENDSTIAACGGKGYPVFETSKPFWFPKYAEAYATGSQEINRENGCLTNLYGAGLALRKSILEQLYQSAFTSRFLGRTGTSLSSSEDTELTYAFVIMGYSLFYSEKLAFFHYLPKERLTTHYLRKLFISFGKDGPIRNLYYSRISKRFSHKLMSNWNVHFMISLFRFVKYYTIPPKKYGRKIYLDWNIAYIRSLLALKSSYRGIKENIAQLNKIQHQVLPH